jgi:hypothetical protein
MTKEEALAFDLALEALEGVVKNCWRDIPSWRLDEIKERITAIKQARALDKMAENARELGLDYEPADGTQVSKVWWDGEKLMAKPIPLEDFYQPVQEPVSMRMPKVGDKVVCLEDESIGTVVYLTAGGSPEIKFDDGSHGTYMLREFAELFGYTTPPAAHRQWVGLTDEEIIKAMPGGIYDCLNDPWDCGVGDGDTLRSIKKDVLRIARAIEAKLKEKNNG